MADTNELQTSIDGLGESPEIDQVLLLMDAVTFIKQWLKEAEPRVKAFIIAEIIRTGKPIHVGPKQWVMTQKKTTKCNDPAATLSALFEATEGDESAVADCLASEAWKHGTVRRMLDEMEERIGMDQELRGRRFATLFTESIHRDVEGKPLKELALIDPAFMGAR